MAKLIGADSLAFISLDGLYGALGKAGSQGRRGAYCDACFTGDYPIGLSDLNNEAERQLSLLPGQ
jgi:amidophosphoribosyltransferase